MAFGTVSRSYAASGTVYGTVYHDFDGNGQKNGASVPFGADAGIENVEVRAYDSTGALVGSATTASDGTYSISVTGAATTSVRIEFDTPAGFYPSPMDPAAIPFNGASSTTRPGPIQFTTVPRGNVNYALINGEIGKSTDMIAAAHLRQGASSITAADDSIWLTPQSMASVTANVANNGETGALWGLAWNRTNQRLWSSAVIRRSSGLGPKGIGGIYMVDTVGAASNNVIASFDLRDYGVVLENVTTSGDTDYDDAERNITGSDKSLYWDVPGYSGVGTEGIGDIDFSKDDRYLFVVNLYQRKIHRFTMGGTANAPTLNDRTDFSVPDTYCTSPNIARPWGIEVTEEGLVNVGAVCTDMVSGTTALTARPDLEKGSILQLNPASPSWSELTTIDFGYTRTGHYSSFGDTTASVAVLRETSSQWQEWTNDWSTVYSLGANPWSYFDWSQPIISDIETVKGGALLVGITNRFNFQTTQNSRVPDPTFTSTNVFNDAAATGDTIYMCKTSTGWLQDLDAACKNNSDWITDNYLGHEGASLGALAAYSPALTQWVASTAYDPGSVYTAGVGEVNIDTGARTYDSAYQSNDFSKSAAMGDIEVLTQNAPVSIGNRLWYDADGDGIQDAGELPVVGATVRLYNSAGTLVGTAITDANGEYYFASNVSEAAAGNSDSSGGGLTAGEAFTVRVDRPQDFTSPSLLQNYAMTSANKSSSTSSLDDEIDSDASLVSGYPRISIPALEWGRSNMSYDIGFAPVVSIGDRVWVDTDRDAVQDVGEVGLAGVTVTLTYADGSPVYDASGNLVTTAVTDSNGNYLFPNLLTAPAGTYKVTMTTPAGYGRTTPISDTSLALTTAGASDLTLDFGVAPAVSVGDLVWVDTDRDGIQDAGEPGIAGVTMSITKADGTAVTDVSGNAVTTTTTDANGNYVFSNLPPGSYKVTATTPSGYIATTAAVGSDRGLDSSTTNATSATLTTAGSSDMSLDFGFVLPRVSVGDYVWVDTDRDGVQDVGESGIAGVTMSITKADGTAVTDVSGNAVITTTTDANGNYVFSNLPPGSYKVTATTPSGYVATTAVAGSDRGLDSSSGFATSTNLAADGASDLTLDFGFVVPSVSVGSLVWKDTDRDGVQDVGESGIAGVTLSITKADGSAVTDVFGNAVTTTTTDANGNYLFANLPPDSYKVTATTPSGYVATTAAVGSDRGLDSSTGFATSGTLSTDGASDLTLDFGFVEPSVSVGNLVWKDIDVDGIQDVGEPGIAGVTMSITKADGTAVTDVFGNAVTTTTTDVNGNYLFANLPVGSYKVTAVTPTGYVATIAAAGSDRGVDSSSGFATSGTLSSNGASDLTLDFGFREPKVGVGDFVWFDTDRDGVQDVGEPGIAGVTLSITKADGTPVTDVFGNPVTTTMTDESGHYLFENLPLGSYKVSVANPSGYTATVAGSGTTASDSSTGDATSTNLTTDATSDLTLDFGFYAPMVSVGNRVWIDTDRDGIQDAGELGIAGVTLSITKADGTAVTDVFGNAVTTTTTDVNGNYLFANLPPGSYKVSVVTPSGYVATTAAVGSDRGSDSSTDTATSTNLATDGASDLTLHFGFVVPSVSVGNFVWKDIDIDGIQDVGEPGIAGVTLSITKADGTPVTDVFGNAVTTTTTDANGNYLFANLPPGSYKVTATTPSGLVATTAAAGSDRGVDSSTGFATSGTLSSNGASDLTLDFGFRDPMVAVGDFVWFDTDRDGVQDVGESGIAGVTLSITKADGSAVTDVFGNAVTTTTTDASGNYLFANLPLGSYKVSVVNPTGYTATVAGAGTTASDSSTGDATSTNLVTDSASDLTLDFGFFAPMVSVGNLVWIDTDRDGVQDVGESGIAGVTLSITKADGTAVTDVFGNAVTTTTTDANGNYLFANLPVGSYKVSVTSPSGYVSTTALVGSDRAMDSSTGTATSASLTTDGASDLTLDFGFVLPKVSVGNLVWIDTDRDGIQDVGESGIAGVTLSITKADGTPVTDVFGNAVTTTTTDANGNYLFANLPVGSYKVSLVTPSGYVATTAVVGSDLGLDSSTDNATSISLTTDGSSDLTLDFGFVVPSVSVGSSVWKDTDRDGVQDVGESGIAGVTLSITKADGTPVTDVFGNAVTTTTTDANGNYLFANLPVGSYKVTAVTPSGHVATTATVGSDRGVDSSTDNATSISLTTDGASDLTLDFGFVVPKVVNSNSSEIPRTGTSTLNVLLVAFALLLVGVGLIMIARRRTLRIGAC